MDPRAELHSRIRRAIDAGNTLDNVRSQVIAPVARTPELRSALALYASAYNRLTASRHGNRC